MLHSNDDPNKMTCGRSTTRISKKLEKISCARQIIGSPVGDLFECLVGAQYNLDCAQEIGGELDGDGMFQIGKECLNIDPEPLVIERQNVLEGNHTSHSLTIVGGIDTDIDIDLMINVQQWQFELNVTSTVESQFDITMESSAVGTYEYEKSLTYPKKMFRTVSCACMLCLLLGGGLNHICFTTRSSWQVLCRY